MDRGSQDGGLCKHPANRDAGLDCCDVCLRIFETCGVSIVDQDSKPLTGGECLTTCGTAANAQKFYACLSPPPWSCEATKLQSCFNKLF